MNPQQASGLHGLVSRQRQVVLVGVVRPNRRHRRGRNDDVYRFLLFNPGRNFRRRSDGFRIEI
ncbi:MAG: hypothetical protein ABIO24_02765, partial [Saprospiraceae bacterium]